MAPPKTALKAKTALLRWKRRFHCSGLSRRLVQPRAATVELAALVALVALVVWGVSVEWAVSAVLQLTAARASS
jgi:hypothetical protein